MGRLTFTLLTLFILDLDTAFCRFGSSLDWSNPGLIPLEETVRTLEFDSNDPNGPLHQPHFKPSATKFALSDRENRVSDEFRIPKNLLQATSFWLDIYTKYSSLDIVVFDRQHPELIYEVIDLRDLQASSRNRVVFEILRERRIKKTIAAYREAFSRLSRKDRHPKSASPLVQASEEKIRRAHQVLRSGPHTHRLQEFSENLGTQTGQRDSVMRGLQAAEVFFPHMDRIFTDFDLPVELTRLSLVESSFNLQATSRVGASGVWQFMERSGKEFMLVEPSEGIDERRSPIKSTIAAAKLLKRNKKILGSWILAITSYNHGLRTFVKIPRHKRTEPDLLPLFSPCNQQSPLGWASRNYYPEFLAMLYAETYRDLFFPEMRDPPTHHIQFEKLRIPQSAYALSLERGIPLQQFKNYNPDIKDLRRPLPVGFTVVLPSDSTDYAKMIEVRKRAKKSSI